METERCSVVDLIVFWKLIDVDMDALFSNIFSNIHLLLESLMTSFFSVENSEVVVGVILLVEMSVQNLLLGQFRG